MHQIESHKYYETMSTGIRNGPNQKNQCENSTIQSKINVIGYIFTHAHTHTFIRTKLSYYHRCLENFQKKRIQESREKDCKKVETIKKKW